MSPGPEHYAVILNCSCWSRMQTYEKDRVQVCIWKGIGVAVGKTAAAVSAFARVVLRSATSTSASGLAGLGSSLPLLDLAQANAVACTVIQSAATRFGLFSCLWLYQYPCLLSHTNSLDRDENLKSQRPAPFQS